MSEFFSLWAFFTDPILNTAAIGSIFMCLASSLVGVIAFIQKRSLIGEALSHATYPGMIIGVLLAVPFLEVHKDLFSLVILVGAFLSALLGLKVISLLEKKMRCSSDTALCFVLSTFLGVGILFVSRLQTSAPIWHQKAQIFLYGQAATMLSSHVILYGVLAAVLIVFLSLYYPRLKVTSFDEVHAKTLGIKVDWMLNLTHILIVFATVVGLRSVGVVLMSGMLIAPAVFARQVAKNLWQMFIYAGAIGMLSGFLGNYFSVNLSVWLMQQNTKVTLPTGPMILITATFFAILALLFSGDRGLVIRVIRKQKFQFKCLQENILKGLYKTPKRNSLKELSKIHRINPISLYLVVRVLIYKGWVVKKKGGYGLTEEGHKKSERIVRLHRLWEVYLFDCLGIQKERVHRSAEEMEHIITPDLEKRLSLLLNDPEKDPHDQWIPRGVHS